MLSVGSTVIVTPEKPAAGGRMIARHEGLVLLVSGAIPGEAVRVRVERVERSLAYAAVDDIMAPHPSRRPVGGDPRCGGAVYAHIDYPEQVRLKAEIIRDALVRLGRIDPPPILPVMPSPERGYRMRARVHLRDGRIGFFLEGTHEICSASAAGQLLPEAAEALEAIAHGLRAAGLSGDADLDVSENVAGDQRAVHVEMAPGVSLDGSGAVPRVSNVSGLTLSVGAGPGVRTLFGHPFVEDAITVGAADVHGGAPPVARLRRHAQAFFQGNRYLLHDLVAAVTAACPPGPVVDLYAGVGLFGVCLAATGRHLVTAVEGHPASAADLRVNAQAHAPAIEVCQMPVERFVRERQVLPGSTLVLDPPRSGMSRAAAGGVRALGVDRIVFVSCDVATCARDVARFVSAGFRLESIQGFDLFPTTAHVEVLAVLAR